MKTVNFGIIGLGLMGRELASATMRWSHLPDMKVRPRIVSICSRTMSSEREAWFRDGLGTVEQVTTDYRELLENRDVDVVYCAVPHNLHEQFYLDIVRAGKHLLAEKPFGIDRAANAAILEQLKKSPEVFVRCCSQFPFSPGMQRVCRMIENDAFGRIIEVEAGFLHSSDLNAEKPINWKRRIESNGRYGVMGDLGMHVCHVPFRSGWVPKNVRAILSNLVTERPDGQGGLAACETWDNATLLVEAAAGAQTFPFTLKTQRIAPGEMNTWYFTVKGMKASARYTTRNVNQIQVLNYDGGEQAWKTIQVGHATTFKSITGGIFETGFSDVMLQMIAGFLVEFANGAPHTKYSGCATPAETALSHALFTAALESNETGSTVEIV